MKASLKDIAKKVGVSTALVSYVINGKEREMRVGEEMVARIKKAARELNYQPNQIAKSLKSGKTLTIGFIVADISNTFFANLARIIEDEAKKSNYTVIFGSSDETPENAWTLMTVLLNRQVDGFIIAPTVNSEELITYLQEKNIPFVLIDRYLPDLPANYVALDNYKAAFDAVSLLIRNGRRRIGMVNYDTSLFHLQERSRGYKQALIENQLQVEPGLLREIRESHIKEDIKEALDGFRALDPPVDAIFFSSNKLTVTGLMHIRDLKLKVPDDIAVVGFDETDAYDLFYCPITYVRQPMADFGKQAVAILLKNIENKKAMQQLNLEATLVVRESSGGMPEH